MNTGAPLPPGPLGVRTAFAMHSEGAAPSRDKSGGREGGNADLWLQLEFGTANFPAVTICNLNPFKKHSSVKHRQLGDTVSEQVEQ